MKILLAGPGTGKTTSIQRIISEKTDPARVLVISFTNATVEELKKSLAAKGISEDNCMTLHKFAVKYNHDKSRHVLETKEKSELIQIASQTQIDFVDLCNFLSTTTFDQMIERFAGYAKANPSYFKEKLSNFSILIVDEYQDFNKNEQELIDLLIDVMEEVYILGDDDQCIYDFKDASSDKIIELHNDTSHERIEHEHRCYRCPDVVVEKATKLIKNNIKRVDKKWEKTGRGGDLVLNQFSTSKDSAKYVVGEIGKILTETEDQILVLSPVGFFVEPLTQALDEAEIAYKNHFAGKVPLELLVRSWALRTLFGQYKYLNLLLLGYRVLPNRRSFYSLIKKHYDSGQNFDAMYQLLLSRLPNEIKTTYPTVDDLLEVPYFQEIKELFTKSAGDTEDEKLENIFVIVEEDTRERINIMSIHKSKGLGADHVFMIGLVEGILPNRAKGNDTIESQRRVFYVGMTRAKKSLYLLSSINLEGKYVNKVNKDDFRFDFRSRIWKGRASRFIEEISI